MFPDDFSISDDEEWKRVWDLPSRQPDKPEPRTPVRKPEATPVKRPRKNEDNKQKGSPVRNGMARTATDTSSSLPVLRQDR